MNKIVIGGLVVFSFLSHAKIVEKVVAIVNETPITLTEIDAFKKKLKSGGLVDDALLKLKDPKKLLKDQKELINHLIDEKVVDSEIKRLGMNVTLEKVEQEIRTITSRNGLSRSQLKAALKERGVLFSDYQDFIKTSLERQSLIDREVSSKIKISDEDISNYYLSKNKGTKGQVFEYKLAHILVKNTKRSGQTAKARMLKIFEKLEKNPDSFSSLASQYSEDPNFSENGLLGTFKAGEMLKEIEAGIQNLSVGKTSKVVKTKIGYHIIKVLNKTSISNPVVNEHRNKIHSVLFAEAFQKQFRKWLNRKRKETFVRIN